MTESDTEEGLNKRMDKKGYFISYMVFRMLKLKDYINR